MQTTLQPWSATIYHKILQQGLQPSLAFVKVPDTLFTLKSTEAGLSSPTAAAAAGSGGSSHGSGPAAAAAVYGFVDCTVSFEEARVAVAADLLTIGYVSRMSGQLHLNPSESSRLNPGDILVALTTQVNVAKDGGCSWQECL